MKRIVVLLAMVALMVVMLAISVGPAFAAIPPEVCQAARERVEGTGHGLIPPPCF